MFRRRLLEASWLLALAACEGTVEPAGVGQDMEAGVVFLGEFELTRQCDRVGAVEVQMRARRVQCDDVSVCTVPMDPLTFMGDRTSCPSAEPTRWLGVAVDEPGRYRVDALVRFATGDPDRACFTDAGDVDVLVTQAEIDAGAERIVSEGPCPGSQ